MKFSRAFLVIFVSFFFFFGCSRGSDEALLEEIRGFDNVNLDSALVDLEVSYEFTEFSKDDFIISDNAKLRIFRDGQLNNRAREINVNVGENTYYLQITSENENIINVYKLDIYRMGIHNIDFIEGQDFEFEFKNLKKTPNKLVEGEKVEFKIIRDPSFSAFVYVNDNLLEKQGDYYKINNLSEDVIIEVTLEARVFDVNIPDFENIESFNMLRLIDKEPFNEEMPSHIGYDENLKFSITKNQYYDGNPIVYNNGVLIEEEKSGGGVYEYGIKNIKEDINIDVYSSSFQKKTVSIDLSHNLDETDLEVSFEDIVEIKRQNGNQLGNETNIMEELRLVFETKGNFVGDVTFNFNSSVFDLDFDDNNQRFESINLVEDSINISVDFSNIRKATHTINYSYAGNQENFSIQPLQGGDMPQSVQDSTTLKFEASLLNDFQGEFIISANGKEVAPYQGAYEIEDIKENTYIVIDLTNIYRLREVNYPFDREGYQIAPENGESSLENTIKEGESISFLIEVLDSYEGEIKVYSNEEKIFVGRKQVITIENIEENINMTVDTSNLSLIQFEIDFENYTNESKFTIENITPLDSIKANYGEDFEFWINLKDKYIGTLDVTTNAGNIICNENNYCIIEEVLENHEIVIDETNLEVRIFEINYPSETDGYTIYKDEGELVNNVLYGESISFSINKDEEYYKGELLVYANGTLLEKNINYQIENIKQNIMIFVDESNYGKITYNLNIEESEKVKIVDSDNNPHEPKLYKGDYVFFKVIFKEGYEGDFSIYLNEEETPACQNIGNDYCEFYVSSVSGNLNIAIDDEMVSLIEYEIDLYIEGGKSEGIKIKDIEEVEKDFTKTFEHGSEICFYVDLINDYRGTLDVKINATTITTQNDLYCYANIEKEIVVTINTQNIYKMYDIDFVNNNGLKIFDEQSSQQETFEVYLGDTFTFYFEIKEGFQGEVLDVKLNNESLVPNENGEYTLNNITNDKEIIFETTIERISYSITYQNESEEDLFYFESLKKETLYHGEDLILDLKIKEGFEGELVVYSNGEETIYAVVEEDKYIFKQVKGNLNINIDDSNISKANYQIEFENFTGHGYTINLKEGYEGDKFTLEFGDSFYFNIEKDDRFIGNIKVYKNESLIEKNEEGKYEIKIIKSDITIFIDDNEYKWEEFNITFSTYDEIKIVDDNKELLDNKILKGETLIFDILHKPGYDGDFDVYIKDSGDQIKIEKENEFYKYNVIGDIQIIVNVSQIEFKEYSVTYTDLIGVSFIPIEDHHLPNTVYFNDKLTFDAVLDEGYKGDFSVELNDSLISKEGDVYNIKDFETNIHLKIVNISVERISFDINYEKEENISFLNKPQSVYYGEDVLIQFEFYLNYGISNSSIKVNNVPKTVNSEEGKYNLVISNVKNKLFVLIDAKKTTFDVNFQEDDEKFEVISNNDPKKGENFYFDIDYSPYVDENNALVKYNDIIIYNYERVSVSSNIYRYYINNVQGNLNIEISVEKEYMNLTHTSSQGINFVDTKEKVFKGEAHYNFGVSVGGNYDSSTLVALVKSDDKAKEIKDNYYYDNHYYFTVEREHFDSNIEIIVAADYIYYNVHFEGEGYRPKVPFQDKRVSDYVKAGENFEFEIERRLHYSGSLSDIEVIAFNSGQEILFKDNLTSWRIEIDSKDIDGVLQIVVNGFVRGEEYRITYDSGKENHEIIPKEGYSFTALDGESFMFKVDLFDNFVKGENFHVLYNNSQLSKQGEYYIIDDVTRGDCIIVKGIEKKEYKISIPTGVKIVSSDNIVYEEEAFVKKETSLLFDLIVDKNYSWDKTLYVNDSELNPVSGSQYFISNINENKTITLGEFERKKHSISYKDIEGISYVGYEEGLKHEILNGDSVYFGVKLESNLQPSKDFKVSFNNKRIDAFFSNDPGNNIYYFKINNLINDGQIEVSGIEEENYKINLDENLENLRIYLNDNRWYGKEKDGFFRGEEISFKVESYSRVVEDLIIYYGREGDKETLNPSSDGEFSIPLNFVNTIIKIRGGQYKQYDFEIKDFESKTIFSETMYYHFVKVSNYIDNYELYNFYFNNNKTNAVIIDPSSRIELKEDLIIYAILKEKENKAITFKEKSGEILYVVDESNYNWWSSASDIDSKAYQEGKIFVGWKSEHYLEQEIPVKENSGTFYSLYGNDIVLIPKLIDEYSVFLDFDIEGEEIVEVKIDNDNYHNRHKIIEEKAAKKIAELGDNLILGWESEKKNLSFEKIADYDFVEEATYKAKWGRNFYINFENTKEDNIDPIFVNSENINDYIRLPIPQNDNYLFLGWYMDEKYELNQSQNLIKDLKNNENSKTLYAKWIEFYPNYNESSIEGRRIFKNSSYNEVSMLDIFYENNQLVVDRFEAYDYGRIDYETSYELYYIGQNKFILGKNKKGYESMILTFNSGGDFELKFDDRNYSFTNKKVVEIDISKDGSDCSLSKSDMFFTNETGLLIKEEIIDYYAVYGCEINYFYNKIEKEKNTEHDFSSFAKHLMTIYGFSQMPKKVVANFYDVDDEAIFKTKTINTAYDYSGYLIDFSLEKEGYTFGGWSYDGRQMGNISQIKRIIKEENLEKINIHPHFFKHQDFSGEEIVEIYIMQEGYSKFSINENGIFEVYLVESPETSILIGKVVKIDEENFILKAINQDYDMYFDGYSIYIGGEDGSKYDPID